ncbi:MAG: hypothetical protein ABIN94_01655 [Ferruginibacter sp.]
MLPEKENKKFNDDLTDKRVHEHLVNENDIISDEDIENVKTDVVDIENITSTKLPEEKSSENEESDAAEKKDEDDHGDRIETPWNILK